MTVHVKNPILRRLVVIATALLLVAPSAAADPTSSGGANDQAASVALYAFESWDAPNGQRLIPLDPMTLADRPGQPPIELGETPSFWSAQESGGRGAIWTASADGATLVGVEYARATVEDPLRPDDVTIIVRDGLTGPERARFHPPGPVHSWSRPLLSGNGARLVVEGIRERPDLGRWMERSPHWVKAPVIDYSLPAKVWYVLDTRDGRLLSTIQSVGQRDLGPWLDAAGNRLYHFAVPNWDGQRDPVPVIVVAHDLTTGAEVGRLEVPDVQFGYWQREGAEGESPYFVQTFPGVALSPDGRQIAVVHPDHETVTLIDAERLAVERVVAISHPTGMLGRLMRLLPLAPLDASAKVSASAVVSAVFALDGRRLFVWWDEFGTEDAGSARRSGLLVVDPASGKIEAEGPRDEPIWTVLPAPDGQSVYVAGRQDDVASTTWLLRRLDAATLATLAEREFPSFREFLLCGAVPPHD